MKGLLCTPEMARAIVAGRKTETRRVVPGRIRPCRIGEDIYYEHLATSTSPHPRPLPGDWCAYQPGETVCVLTTWAVAKQFDHLRPCELPRRAMKSFWHAGMTLRKPLCNVPPLGKSRSGRFLPNQLRHLVPWLNIKDVDVQRLHGITEAAAIAEGVTAPSYLVESASCSAVINLADCYRIPTVGDEITHLGKISKITPIHAVEAFRALWDSINKKRGKGWAKNPQVFVIKFESEIPF